MGKKLIWAVSVLALWAAASPCLADMYEQTIHHGTHGGVSYSFLTTKTTLDGHLTGGSTIWKIGTDVLEQSLNVLFDAPTAAVTSAVGLPQIKIFENAASPAQVGTMTITGMSLDNLVGVNAFMGSIDFTLSTLGGNGNSTWGGLVAPNETYSVRFLKKDYGSASGFNSVGLDGTTLRMRLWGNEQIADGTSGTGNVWGLDWNSSGEPVTVPAPGAVLLGIVGLGTIKSLRRRLA